METVRIVAAIGGNALLRRGQPAEADLQRQNLDVAVRAIAEIAEGQELVVTHGNGPQVGLLALQAAAYPDVEAYPLDVLGAESEGMIGYLLEQALLTHLPSRRVASMLTLVEVDPSDPAFSRPTKPIGPIYHEESSSALAEQRGWVFRPEEGGFRRVVASPEPRRVLELSTIKLLIEAGVLVVCAGGGGVPVVVTDSGALYGVEAVIDKDLSAALIATELDADALLLLTDVEAVFSGWGTGTARPIARASPAAIRALGLASGSMGPKVEAASRFCLVTGRTAYIGALTDARRLLTGEVGTQIGAESEGITHRG